MGKNYALSEIANALGGRIVGDDSTIISSVSSLQNAKSGDICFINDTKYVKVLAGSKASAVVLRQKDESLTDLPKIIVDNPYETEEGCLSLAAKSPIALALPTA